MTERMLPLVALLSLTLLSAAHAQRAAPRFELGVYGGGALNTSWFTDASDEGWGIGLQPIFGAEATFWTSPSFGVRFNGSYMPSALPGAEDVEHPDEFGLNTYLLDLEAVLSPWSASARGDLMTSTYFFLGGGLISTGASGDVPATPGPDPCVAYQPWLADGICVPTEGKISPQGVLGAHTSFFPIGTQFTLFGEAAIHGFPAPVDVCEGETQCPGERKLAFLTRLVVGVQVGLGGR